MPTVREILIDSANALAAAGHGAVTTPLFWRCGCEHNNLRDNWSEECPLCYAQHECRPDAPLGDVLRALAGTYSDTASETEEKSE